MKTIILRKELNATRLSCQLSNFFKNLNINNIYIEKIVLTLHNNKDFILAENISVDKTNINQIKTVKKLIIKKFLNIINQVDINIPKESNYVMYLYKDLS